MTDSPNPALAHLLPAQVEALARAYFAGEPAADLLRRYQIQVRPNFLHSLLPAQPMPQLPCAWCGRPMWRKPPPRSASRWVRPPLYCTQCGHTSSQDCSCVGCTAAQRTAHERLPPAARQRAIEDYCAKRAAGPLPDGGADALDLDAALGLLAIWHGYQHSPNGLLVPATTRSAPPLTPWGTAALFAWTGIDDHRLVVPSAQSPPDAFVFEDEQTIGLDYRHVCWTIRHADPAGLVEALTRKALRPGGLPSWREELADWRAWLAWAEVMAHVSLLIQEQGWPMRRSDLPDELIHALLEHHAPAQCCALAAQAAQRTARTLREQPALYQEVARLYTSDIEQIAREAQASGRKVRCVRRHPRLPRSVLSRVLYELFEPTHQHDGYLERPASAGLHPQAEAPSPVGRCSGQA